jgi:acylphosphatase
VICVRFVVSGKVQGVFFRASARDQAQRLDLCGHAKNLADGSVEVIACGDDANIEALERWLQTGPAAARVESVSRSIESSSPPRGFRTL